jgi:glutamine amidotransferase-like uncharacterized protein
MIYIYSDTGTSRNSVAHLVRCLGLCAPNLPVVKLSAPELIAGQWQNDARCLIMPGGADLPYAEKLNGQGNKIISDYVATGGTYIGICAGAYYAARRIEFDAHGENPIVGERELGFFPGTIIGPHWAPYDKGHHSGARAVTLYSNSHDPWDTYINGGGHFVMDPDGIHRVTPIAWDKDNALVMVGMRVQKGFVFLSAAHWEYDPLFIAPCCTTITPPCLNEAVLARLVASNEARTHVVVSQLWQKIMGES